MSDTLPDGPDEDEPEPVEAVAPPVPTDARDHRSSAAAEDAPAAQRRDSPGDTSS